MIPLTQRDYVQTGIRSLLGGMMLLLWFCLGPTMALAEEIDPELRALVKKAASETDSFADRFDAEVWLTDMSHRLEKRVPDPSYRIELLKNVHYEANRAGLTPELVLAIIEVESNFSQYAISHAGARGLMQVMPFWLKEIGKPGDSLFRIHTNLRLGCTILQYYLTKERGNLQMALRRYNGTTERRYADRVNVALKTRWYRQ
jgi:soluble lytic murein transglycosylase-like protein